jgi:V/A-type H+-transporting ATPase subunit I
MLRPERMSKVSVTGSKRVMDDAIEAIHELNLVHLSEYDGSWEGFESGDPAEGADPASEKLVTVRSLKSILDVDDEDAGPDRMVADERLEEELERVREEANDLDDRRSDLEEELREVEASLDEMDPFVSLGIDLDLLGGYETIDVAVGQGDEAGIRTALAGADTVDEFDTFVGDDGHTVAIFARTTTDGGDPISDALVGVEFDPLEVPEGEGNPRGHVDELEHRKKQLESELSTVEDEIHDLKLDAAGFLLAAEEKLSIEVQTAEAPLSFATTKNSFVAEGWIPTDRYDDLVLALDEAVGNHVEIEELERAKYTEEGHPEEPEPVEDVDHGGSGAVATDGGTATMDDEPPTMMDNPGATKPMELLVKTTGRPNYTEFDPTFFVFLTFPAFFGLMIGDLGYGFLYMAIGGVMYSRFDNAAVNSMGGVAMWAGGFTAVFGVLYGEIFGLHVLGELYGGPVFHKGLQPAFGYSARGWLVVALLLGLLHVVVGHLLGFAKNLRNHGAKEAVFENGSWIVLTVAFWAFVFSKVGAGMKPNFVFSTFASEKIKAGSTIPGTDVVAESTLKPMIQLGFTGLPETVGLAAVAAILVGFVMLIIGEGLKAIEVLQAIVNVLSYARLMAVLLAKAGMAFVVNLLVFGAYETTAGAETPGEFHFIFIEGGKVPEYGELMFDGLFTMGPIGIVGGLLVLVIGHMFVLALGVTSAGLQSIRLEYVEFFGKFYDGGGRTYNPFGYSREHTTED